jgi:hypothetical protein
MPGSSTRPEQPDVRLFIDDHADLVEAPECRNRSGRGALTGVLLGAGLWTVILAATGVIKL